MGRIAASGTRPGLAELDAISLEMAGFPVRERGFSEADLERARDPKSNVALRANTGGPANNSRIPEKPRKSNERGSVALVNGRLVGDTEEGLRLWTHPNWNANGYFEGVYDLSDFMIPGRRYTPEQEDHLSGEIGIFTSGKSWPMWCGEVTFSITLRSKGVTDFTLVGPTLLDCDHTRSAFNAYIPAQFYGKPISIVLRADAGADSTLDHAGWKDVVLLRG